MSADVNDKKVLLFSITLMSLIVSVLFNQPSFPELIHVRPGFLSVNLWYM